MNAGERKLKEYLDDISGSFYRALFNAIFKADQFNLQRLKMGFPEEVQAVIDYRTVHGYIENVLEAEDG